MNDTIRLNILNHVEKQLSDAKKQMHSADSAQSKLVLSRAVKRWKMLKESIWK